MQTSNPHRIRLRPYGKDDFPLLERLLGDPKMMIYLGGPESHEQLLSRHQRYLKSEGCYTIEELASKKSIGWIGNWEVTKYDEQSWETGWNVLPEYQGKGFATEAINLLFEKLQDEKKFRYIYAFPNVNNGPSNALCRKTGFIFMEEERVEYPKGNFMQCNNWRYDLESK